jgi:hypothetical protein
MNPHLPIMDEDFAQTIDAQMFSAPPKDVEDDESQVANFSYEEIESLIKEAESYWQPHYDRMSQDLVATYSTDPKRVFKSRIDPERAIYPIPVIKRHVKKVAAMVLRNKPGIKISGRSLNVAGEPPIAGVVRYLESQSGASSSYRHAVENAVCCGLSFLRIKHDPQASPILQVRHEADVKKCYLDPESRELDGSDAKYCFIKWTKKRKHKKETMDPIQEPYKAEMECLQFYQRRKGKVFWCQVEDREIVAEGQFFINWLPLIPIYGSVEYPDGDMIIEGETRALTGIKDNLEYAVGLNLEALSMDVRAPIIAAEGSVIDPDAWMNSVEKPPVYLEYKAYSNQGQSLPPPLKFDRKPDVAWLQGTLQILTQLMGDVSGVTQESIGAEEKELSSLAIEMRQQAMQYVAATYLDNFVISLKRLGKNIADFAALYMADGQSYMAMHEDGRIAAHPVLFKLPDGSIGRTSFDTDDIEISVDTGKSFDTQRQEFTEKFADLAQRLGPETMSPFMDLFFANIDIPNGEKFAERAYKLLPTAVRADGTVSMAEFEQIKAQNADLQAKLNAALDMNAQREKMAMARGAAEAQTNVLLENIKSQDNMAIQQMKSQEAVYLEELKHQHKLEQDDNNAENQQAMNEMNAQNEEGKEVFKANVALQQTQEKIQLDAAKSSAQLEQKNLSEIRSLKAQAEDAMQRAQELDKTLQAKTQSDVARAEAQAKAKEKSNGSADKT